MNLNNPNKDKLIQLIAAQNDSEGHHILWVDNLGDVHCEVLPSDLTPAGWDKKMEGNFKFRMESYVRGNGYVGPEASRDDDWMSLLYSKLLEKWSSNTRGLADT